MKKEELKLNPNPLMRFLEKPMAEFTKADILKVIEEFEIEMISFRYMADDGRLKTLNFVIQSLAHAEEVLTSGERVDGSSLFPYIEAGNSDLYVIPRFRTAFLDPFTEVPTLDLLCSFYTKDGIGLNTFRLNFSAEPEERIVEGIHRLGDLLKEYR